MFKTATQLRDWPETLGINYGWTSGSAFPIPSLGERKKQRSFIFNSLVRTSPKTLISKDAFLQQRSGTVKPERWILNNVMTQLDVGSFLKLELGLGTIMHWNSAAKFTAMFKLALVGIISVW